MDPVDIFDSFDEVSKRDNYHLGRAGESQLEFCRGRRVAMRLMRLVVVAPSIIACLIRLYLVWSKARLPINGLIVKRKQGKFHEFWALA
jgi:hypothetical protein